MAVFVYYLDGCNTALWKVFFLSVWLASLWFCQRTGMNLLGSWGEEKQLRESNITGTAYERLKPNVPKRTAYFLLSVSVSVAVLWFFIWYYSVERCTPESIFWVR